MTLSFLRRNASTIMTIGAVCGTFLVSYFSAEAGVKSHEIIEEVKAKKNLEECEECTRENCGSECYEASTEITVSEKVKACWKIWVKPGVAIIVTTALAIGANRLDAKMIAGLTGALATGAKKFKDYRAAVYENVDEETATKIERDYISKEVQARDFYADPERSIPCSRNRCFPNEDGGDTLFYLPCIDKAFWSNWENVVSAEMHLNRNFVLGGPCNFETFAEFLGLKLTDHERRLVKKNGDWDSEDFYQDGIQWLDFEHTYDMVPHVGECMHIIPSALYW